MGHRKPFEQGSMRQMLFGRPLDPLLIPIHVCGTWIDFRFL